MPTTEVSPLMAMSAAFKPSAPTVTTPVAAVMTAAPTASAIASASLWPLEAGARVARDARGIAAFKFLPRRARIARSACLAGQKNHVFFDDGTGNHALGGHRGRFELNVLDGFVMRDVGTFGLSQFRVFFLVPFFRTDFFLLVLVVFRFGGKVLFGFVDFLVMLVGKLFGFLFLLEIGSAHECVRFGARLRFFMLGFHQAGRECRQFFFAQTSGAIAMNVTLRSFFVRFLGLSGCCLCSLREMLFRGSLSRSGFRFGFVVRQNPMRQTAGEPAWHARTGLQADCRTRGGLLEIWLALFRFPIGNRFDWCLWLTPAVLREGFARQNNVVFTALGRGRTRATIATAAIVIATRFAFTLRRSVLRRRQVSSAAVSMRAPVAVAAPAPSPASAPAASTTVSSAITTAVTAAISTRATITADPWRIVSRWVVARGKILRRGSVRFRLALLQIRGSGLRTSLFAVRGRALFALFQAMVIAAQVLFLGSAVPVAAAFFRGALVEADHLFMDSSRRKGFPR